jgi:hypothetical protein
MVEAVRTTASTAELWAIVVVPVACLAFWLGAIAVADIRPFWRGRAPNMPGPVLGGMHSAEGGRSVAPSRDAPATFTEPLPGVPAQRSGEADRPEHSVTGSSTAKQSGAGS